MSLTLNKIYIVGSAGSGKTTLANLISKRFGHPHFDLDDIAYPHQKAQPLNKRLQAIDKLAQKGQWAAEGIYVSWVAKLFKEADKIIWLDLPLWLTLFRITKRFIINKLTGQDPHGFKAFLRLTRGLIHYHYPNPAYESDKTGEYITQEKIKNALKPYSEKVIRVKSDHQLARFLNSLSHSSLQKV